MGLVNKDRRGADRTIRGPRVSDLLLPGFQRLPVEMLGSPLSPNSARDRQALLETRQVALRLGQIGCGPCGRSCSSCDKLGNCSSLGQVRGRRPVAVVGLARGDRIGGPKVGPALRSQLTSGRRPARITQEQAAAIRRRRAIAAAGEAVEGGAVSAAGEAVDPSKRIECPDGMSAVMCKVYKKVRGLSGIVGPVDRTRSTVMLRSNDNSGHGREVPVSSIRAIVAAMPDALRFRSPENRIGADGFVPRRRFPIVEMGGTRGRGAVQGGGAGSGS